MSHRFRGVVPLALLTVAALAAGCDDKSGSTPEAAAPATSATSATAAAGPTAKASPSGATVNETCTTVTKIVIDGSVEIADDAVKSIDERWSSKEVNDHLRGSFNTMAKKVAAEVPKVSDPELRAEVQKLADGLAKGAKSSKPDNFLQKDFQTLGKSLDKSCGA